MSVCRMILDVDGTLVLSNDVHAQAWVEAFAELSYAVPFGRVRLLLCSDVERTGVRR
jgi:beta-phosphoglucomutase-like phosphatase (HAD superfamily)